MVLGLDMLFLGGKQQKKNEGKANAMKSVASPFGLCSSLRQSGSAIGLAFYGAAEAAPLQNNYFSVSSDQVGKLTYVHSKRGVNECDALS